VLWFTWACELLRPLIAILVIGFVVHLSWKLLAWLGHRLEWLVD